VIPNLRGVVEYLGMIRMTRRRSNDVLDGHVGEFCTDNQFVQGIDVGLMMLAIVKAQGIRRYDGRQRALIEGKRR
jgi:hypothetical protein